MKKVKLYAMAFAAMFFAASCQDDAIDPGQGQGNGTDGTPAYLTISFTANGGSSTRASDDGLNTGDTDGDADDSGHHSAGDNHESDVNEALVIVAPVNGNVGFAQLYSSAASGGLTSATTDDIEEATDTDGFKIVDDGTKTYYNANPIEVATGEYKILVVINPVSDITTGLTFPITSGPEVTTLYNDIINGQYKTTGGLTGSVDGTKYCDDLADTEENGDGFMMANKAERKVTLTEENTPENPASASVEVERVISKITYRTVETNNIYEVQVPGVVKANTVIGYVKTSDITGTATNAEENEETGETIDISQYTAVILNEAHDQRKVDDVLTPQTVWAYFKSNNPTEEETQAEEAAEESDFVAAFRPTGETYTVPTTAGTKADVEEGKTYYIYEKLTPVTQQDYTEGEKEYVVASTDDPAASLDLQSTSSDYATWYVKLVGYALTNLSKDVYYVRHTTGGLTGAEPFGELGTSRYLYTPYFNDKSSVTFVQDDENNTTTFPSDAKVGDWFYNTLADVSEESATLTYSDQDGFKAGESSANATYFQKFPTGEGDDVTNDAEIVGQSPQHPSGESLDKTGARMAYVFENSVTADHQVHGLTTGIVFAAQIYKKNDNGTLSEPADGLYYYQNHVFESLEAIEEAYSNVEIKENATKEELAAMGITPFEDNMCYYYTSRIKHFDNGIPTDMGIMEFAIMRNNIYSLSVTGISEIGTPIVDPTPDTPNESQKAALNLDVQILPWIVRYNDIEF